MEGLLSVTVLPQLRGVSRVRGQLRDRTVEETVEPNKAGVTQGAREKGGEGPKPAVKGEFEQSVLLSFVLGIYSVHSH